MVVTECSVFKPCCYFTCVTADQICWLIISLKGSLLGLERIGETGSYLLTLCLLFFSIAAGLTTRHLVVSGSSRFFTYSTQEKVPELVLQIRGG